MNDLQALQEECGALAYQLNVSRDEKDKLGKMYEELQKEKDALERHHEFLLGQVEAFRFCIKYMGREQYD